MKTHYTTLILTLSITIANAQDWTTYPPNVDTNLIANIDTNSTEHQIDSSINELNYNTLNSEKSQLIIFKDKRIDLLEDKLKEEKNILGFTVQIEVSQQTNIIKDTRLKFIKTYPKHPIFDEYVAPNTYLFAGRFYDKNDALAFQHKIKADFTNTMVIKKSILPPHVKEK
jgi:hypothetical protein